MECGGLHPGANWPRTGQRSSERDLAILLRATVVPESVKERRVANLGGDRLGRGFDDFEAILAYSEVADSMSPSRQSGELHNASFRSRQPTHEVPEQGKCE